MGISGISTKVGLEQRKIEMVMKEDEGEHEEAGEENTNSPPLLNWCKYLVNGRRAGWKYLSIINLT